LQFSGVLVPLEEEICCGFLVFCHSQKFGGFFPHHFLIKGEILLWFSSDGHWKKQSVAVFWCFGATERRDSLWFSGVLMPLEEEI
jgi:hypothetical protein